MCFINQIVREKYLLLFLTTLANTHIFLPPGIPGIVERVDELLPLNGGNTTMGERVKAMILNGLGFTDSRLYMFPEFLENYPVKRMFRAGIKAEMFNDDALGRALDSIDNFGVTKLYSTIAMPIGVEHGLLGKSTHVDTSTLSLYGNYDGCEDEDSGEEPEEDRLAEGTTEPAEEIKNQETEVKESVADEIDYDADEWPGEKSPWPQYGFAKNNRHDLKQMTLNLATTGKSGFPVWCGVHSGNASDKKVMLPVGKKLNALCRALKDAPEFLVVGDCAMYDACLKDGNGTLWLTRVPESHGLAKELVQKPDSELTWAQIDEHYKISCVVKEYKKIKQRWCLVFSQHAYDREIATFEKRLKEDLEVTTKALWHLSNQHFACSKDAQTQLKFFRKKLKWHEVEVEIKPCLQHKGRGKPKAGAELQVTGYQITGRIKENKTKTDAIRNQKGRFILATNQLDETALPNAAMLTEYKDQSKTESGFKFIKDNTFEVSSVFLKKPGRIAALMMIMTLCLMVYGFVQHYVREELRKQKKTVPNQKKKETDNPTAAWIFKILYKIQLVLVSMDDCVKEFVANVDELRASIIRLFGHTAMQIYDVT
jgi:transposase